MIIAWQRAAVDGVDIWPVRTIRYMDAQPEVYSYISHHLVPSVFWTQIATIEDVLFYH